MIKKSILLCLLIVVTISCKKNNIKNSKQETPQPETTIKTYTYNEIEPLLKKENDTTYIINFWATWCAPCVKELPVFEKLNTNYSNKKVKILLVSLDIPNHVNSKLIPFLERKKLKCEVVLLNDINEDYWIKAIDENWSGAIPATIIYNKNKRNFYEQSFDDNTLETELQTFLN